MPYFECFVHIEEVHKLNNEYVNDTLQTDKYQKVDYETLTAIENEDVVGRVIGLFLHSTRILLFWQDSIPLHRLNLYNDIGYKKLEKRWKIWVSIVHPKWLSYIALTYCLLSVSWQAKLKKKCMYLYIYWLCFYSMRIISSQSFFYSFI